MHLRPDGEGGVAEHADVRLGTIAVAQGNGIVDNRREVGVRRRFAITRKGEDVGQFASVAHAAQLGLKRFAHLLTRRTRRACTMILIQSTFTIDAVEAAQLTIVRHQIDAQGYAEAPTVHRAKHGRSVEYHSLSFLDSEKTKYPPLRGGHDCLKR